MRSLSACWRTFGIVQFVGVAALVLFGLSYCAETQAERDYKKLLEQDIPVFAEAVSNPQTNYNYRRMKESKGRMESYIEHIQSIQKDRRSKMLVSFGFAGLFFIGGILCLGR